MKIWAQTLCHNEENFIWYALMSVVEQVDKVMVWDTGSTDKTVALIQDVAQRFPDKIEFKECGRVDRAGVSQLRQAMLEQTEADWFLIVDGDEVWWTSSLEKLISQIKEAKNDLAALVVPCRVPVGDIYHWQSDRAGKYQLAGRKGHLNIRAVNRRIPGLKVAGVYPLEGYVDLQGRLIQDRPDIEYVEAPYLHLTHLSRSPKQRARETGKLEIGQAVESTVKFPEVLQLTAPMGVRSPWMRLGGVEWLVASGLTVLRQLKRRLSQ